MNPVSTLRMLLLVLFASLVGAACGSGAGDGVWLAYDELELTEDQVVEFAAAQSGDESIPSLSGDAVRGLLRDIVIANAAADLLAEQGTTPDAATLAADVAAIRTSLVEDIADSNPLPEQFALATWVQQTGFTVFERRLDADGNVVRDAGGAPLITLTADMTEYLEGRDVEVANEIGAWDLDSGEVLPPSLANR